MDGFSCSYACSFLNARCEYIPVSSTPAFLRVMAFKKSIHTSKEIELHGHELVVKALTGKGELGPRKIRLAFGRSILKML